MQEQLQGTTKRPSTRRNEALALTFWKKLRLGVDASPYSSPSSAVSADDNGASPAGTAGGGRCLATRSDTRGGLSRPPPPRKMETECARMESGLCARGLAAAAAATGARRRSGGEEISLSMALALRALAAWLDEDLICLGLDWEGSVLWPRGGDLGR